MATTESFGHAAAEHVADVSGAKSKAIAAKIAAHFGAAAFFVYFPRWVGLPHSSQDFMNFWEIALFGKTHLVISLALCADILTKLRCMAKNCLSLCRLVF